MRRRRTTARRGRLIHTRARALERFGVELGARSLEDLVREIQEHRSVFVRRSTQRVTVHLVLLRRTLFCVVYDRVHKCPVTVLPIEPWMVVVWQRARPTGPWPEWWGIDAALAGAPAVVEAEERWTAAPDLPATWGEVR